MTDAGRLPGLSIEIAGVAERPVLENLLQLYIHDFSELFAGSSRGDLEADGRYHADIPIADWWREPGHVPLLMRMNGRIAGFALLNGNSHVGGSIDWNIAEFFVVRKYRRQGVGRAAAHALFDRYPGRWEAAVMRANTGAHGFWQLTIAGHPGLQSMHVADDGHLLWEGTVYRFEIAAT